MDVSPEDPLGKSRQVSSPSPLVRATSSDPTSTGRSCSCAARLLVQANGYARPREPAAMGRVVGNRVRRLEQGRLCSCRCGWGDMLEIFP